MSSFTLRIKTDNAAFEGGDLPGAVSMMLAQLATNVLAAGHRGEPLGEPFRLMDRNGNTVGQARFTSDDDQPDIYEAASIAMDILNGVDGNDQVDLAQGYLSDALDALDGAIVDSVDARAKAVAAAWRATNSEARDFVWKGLGL